MADERETRVPDDLEEGHSEELTPGQYEASVPANLSGFRGINPTVLVVVIAAAAIILIFGAWTALSRFLAPPSAMNQVVTSTVSAQPAAPGVNGPAANATPFIPAPETPFPSSSSGANPFVFGASPTPRSSPTIVPTPPPPPPVQTYPPQQPPLAGPILAQQPIAQAQPADDKMTLEQAPAGSGGPNAEDALAQRDLANARGVRYVPVYQGGRIVAVVPVPHNQAGTQQGPPTVPQSAAAPTAPPPEDVAATQGSQGGNASAQFVSSNDAQSLTTLPAQQQERYVKDQAASSVGYAEPLSKYQLDVTTVINARLLSRIVSDLPGSVIAQVTTPVYDSASHSVIVIPAGTKLFGTYDNAVVQNQRRLLMAFQRLVFPDGREFVIAGQPGTDAGGASGFEGDVDKHRGELYSTAFLLTVLGAADAALTPQQVSVLGTQSVAQQAQSAAGAQLVQLGNRIINQTYQRPPTIIIRPPYQFQVIVVRDLPLDRYLAGH